MGDGTSIGSSGSSHTLSAGSPGSGTSFPALGMPPYGYDGSMSSSQSISPSSSMEADNRPDNLMSLEDFLAEANKTPNRVCMLPPFSSCVHAQSYSFHEKEKIECEKGGRELGDESILSGSVHGII